ncbi:hypothetical protein Tco_0540392 [Tanacetum coccineum]
MSSPDHPTANLEDVFLFFQFPKLCSANFFGYVPPSPWKNYSSVLSNLFGIVTLASPIFLLFPNDPYMKALQAFYTEKSPIPPPIIIPPKTQESSFYQKDSFHQQNHLLLPRSNLKLLRLAKPLEKKELMPPKRASTTEAPAMTQDAIRKLVADSVTSALEAQAATMAS